MTTDADRSDLPPDRAAGHRARVPWDPARIAPRLAAPGLQPARAVVAAVAGRGDVERLLAGAQDLAWPEVRDGLRPHKLLPLLAHAVEVGLLPAAAFGPEVRDGLREERRRAARRVLATVGRAAEALDALEAAGLPAVVIKGAVLAEALYGDAVARGAGDIDLVVDPTDVAAAEVALAGLGYERGLTWAGTTGPAPTRHYLLHAIDLRHPGHRITIDLQWRIDPFTAVFPPSLAPLLATRVERELAGARLRTLPADRLLAAAAAHATRSCHMRLKWLADLGRMHAEHTAVLDLAAAGRGSGMAREVLDVVTGEAPLGGVGRGSLLALDALLSPQDDLGWGEVWALRWYGADGLADRARVAARLGGRVALGPLTGRREQRAYRWWDRATAVVAR